MIIGRCGKQCRERWVNILNPTVKKGNWTCEEQNVIYDQLKYHLTGWSNMSKILKGRTENSIKNYFYSSLRRLKSNPVFHIIKDIYFTGKIDFKDFDRNNPFLKSEIGKLNTLSKNICIFFLYEENKDSKFLKFLSNILFSEDKKIKDRKVKEKKNDFLKKKENEREKKNNFEISNLEKNDKEKFKYLTEEEKYSILEVLKRYSKITKKNEMFSFLEKFDNNLEKVDTIKFDGNILSLKINECWNCKNSTQNSQFF